jgi:hypothetical protein
MHLCGQSSCTELAYSLAFRIGWQAAALVVALLLLAPNLLVAIFGTMQSRPDMMALRGMEKAIFESNAEKAAMYQDAQFCFSQSRGRMPASYDGISCSGLLACEEEGRDGSNPRSGGSGDGMQHRGLFQRICNMKLSPSRSRTKTAFFYKPLQFGYEDEEQQGNLFISGGGGDDGGRLVANSCSNDNEDNCMGGVLMNNDNTILRHRHHNTAAGLQYL